MPIDVILGLQWGDEGKGKIVDYLAPRYDIICRFQGGPNAGHTLKFDGRKFVLHTVPSGIFRKDQLNVIGNGVVLDPITFGRELAGLRNADVDYLDRLLIARKAHLILPTHRMLDAASEAAKGVSKIGSTLKGIGPTYMDKTGRNGLRIGDVFEADFEQRYRQLKDKHLNLLRMYPEIEYDLSGEEAAFMEAIEELRSLQIIDCEYYINKALAAGRPVLAEGAQGSMLDIDFGTYPFVTSSNTVTAGVCTGLGVAPNKIGAVIGITKAYCTRVGSGPFPTELDDATGERLRTEGAEFGATTGRPRRCGWLDLVQLRYTCMLNGVTELVMTKVDVLNAFEEIAYADTYQIDALPTRELPYDLSNPAIRPVYTTMKGWQKDLQGIRELRHLPAEVNAYIHTISEKLALPFSMVSTGPDREELISCI